MATEEADGGAAWPPAPDLNRGRPNDGVEITTCPTCHRRLLTKVSVLCNWCGAVIADESYQARAAEERAAQDAAVRERLQREQLEAAQLGSQGRLKKIVKKRERTDISDLLK